MAALKFLETPNYNQGVFIYLEERGLLLCPCYRDLSTLSGRDVIENLCNQKTDKNKNIFKSLKGLERLKMLFVCASFCPGDNKYWK